MSLYHRNTPQERLPDEEVRQIVTLRTDAELGPVQPVVRQRRDRRWPLAAASLLLAATIFVLLPRVSIPTVPKLPTLDLSLEHFAKPGDVPYGPDIAPGLKIDTSFRPAGPLPKGIALTAMIGQFMWGCGDRNVAGAQPPDGAPRELIRKRIGEIAEYVREQSNRRGLQATNPYMDPKYKVHGRSVATTFSLGWSNGTSSAMAELPLGDDAIARRDMKRIVDRVTDEMCDSLADGIQFTRQNDPNLP